MTLRVLMTTDTAGGVWVHALALSRALAPFGVRVRLVALGQPSSAQRAAAAAAANVELIVRPVQLEWMADPWRDLDALDADLLALADQGRCDLVHLNHLVHGHLDWRRPVLCAVHSCVLSWFEAVRGSAAPSSWQRYRQRVSRSLRAADYVIAPSRWMLQQAEKHYGPFDACRVVRNGSAAPLADPHRTRQGALAGGRVWDDAKNLAPLTQITTRLPGPLRIAGPVQAPEPTGTAGGESVAPADPVMLGDVDQERLWALMRESQVFVAPALYEPFGLAVLEAARSGCALVLGDIPSLREIWGEAAVYIDPRAPEGWPKVLERLFRDDEERLRLARAARRRAARYTAGQMGEAYLGIYHHALNPLSGVAS